VEEVSQRLMSERDQETADGKLEVGGGPTGGGTGTLKKTGALKGAKTASKRSMWEVRKLQKKNMRLGRKF